MSEKLDFDHLISLCKNEPEAFEEFREREIEKLIASASPNMQRRLRGLQFRIDAKREIHRNAPFATCVEISKMMHESFAEMRCYLNQLVGKSQPNNSQPAVFSTDFSNCEPPANVLNFPR